MADNNNPIYYSDLVKPDDAIEKLIAQLEALMTKYEETRKTIKDEAIQITASLNMVSGATEQGRQTTKKAASDADRLARAQEELRFAESESAKKLAELNEAKREQNQINKLIIKLNQSAEGSYNRLSAQYSLNKIYINNMTKAERENTAEGKKLVEQTKEIYEEMKRLQEATGKHQLNVGNYTEASNAIIKYGDSIKEQLHLNNAFGESLLAMGRGGAESKAALTAVGDGVKALSKTLLGLLKNPVFLSIAGIAGAGMAFKWWYDYNAGLVEATRLTEQFTGKSGDDLKGFRNEVQGIAEAFNLDFRETLMSANAVAKQFGISADEALKLIKDGLVSGGNANGEFLDTLKEYPAYFKEAGLSAEQFTAIVVQTNKAGIFSDKGVDAIKEANLRLREMTTATAAALEGIGISSEQVQKDLQSGAKTTFQVMQDVSEKLNEFPESSSAVGTAIADIFGGPGEDAGLQYLKTLKDISTDMDVVKDKAGELGKLQDEQLQSEIELQNALAGLFDMTGGNFESMSTRLKTFTNKALIGLIKGVINLTNYFIGLYNDSVAFRALWQGIVAAFKTNFDFIGNLFNYFIDLLHATGTALKAVFTLDLDTLKSAIGEFASALPKLINANVKDANENFAEGLAAMNKTIKPLTIPVSFQATGGGEVANAKTPGKPTAVKTTGTAAVEKAGKKVVEAKKKTAEELRKIEIEQQRKSIELVKKSIEIRLAAVIQGSEEEKRLRMQLLEQDELLEYLTNPNVPESLIRAKYKKLAEVIEDEYNNIQLNEFDAQQRLEQSQFDLDEHSERDKERFRLNAEKARLQKQLELNKTANKKMSDAEVQEIQNRMKRIDQLLAENERQKDIYDALGLNLTDDQKEGINTSLEYAKNALNEITAARVEAANAAVANADKEVESAERALDAERMARANGYASNVEMAQKELNQAKKNQRDALKEQEKAKKQQLAIQSIEQVGNLVTASSLIWSQLGFPGAIPALAIMWASFAASKIKAVQLINQGSEKYADGTVELLAGGSHAFGHDVDMGTTPDGRHRRAEGGEFFAVINKRNSRRYRHVIPDVIRSFNNGTFAKKYMNAYDADGMSLNIAGGGPDITNLSNDVHAIKEQNERRTYVDASGRTIQVYKNLTRKIN